MTARRKASKPSFTLIEILIVLAIISTIATVLLSVLDPRGQFYKARDRAMQATLGKMALAISAYDNVYGDFPAFDEFATGADPEIQNVVADPAPDTDATNETVLFSISGLDLPSKCDTTGWQGVISSDSSPCRIFYDAHTGCVVAKTWVGETSYYRYLPGMDSEVTLVENKADADLCNVNP